MVYDITSVQSFQSLLNWRSIFLSKSNPKIPESVPIIVIGNKLDLAATQRKVRQEDIAAFCKANGDMQHFEASAKDNINVEKVFKDLAYRVILRQEELSKTPGLMVDPSGKKLNSQDRRGKPTRPDGEAEEKKKSDCCK